MENAGGSEGESGEDDDFTPEALQKMMRDAGIEMPETGQQKPTEKPKVVPTKPA